MSPVGIYFFSWHQLRANSLLFEQAFEFLGPHSGFNCYISDRICFDRAVGQLTDDIRRWCIIPLWPRFPCPVARWWSRNYEPMSRGWWVGRVLGRVRMGGHRTRSETNGHRAGVWRIVNQIKRREVMNYSIGAPGIPEILIMLLWLLVCSVPVVVIAVILIVVLVVLKNKKKNDESDGT